MSLPIGETAVLISLSVVSSVQCCIVISGIGDPVRSTFISHRPALRTGRSTARASLTGSATTRPSATQHKANCLTMATLLAGCRRFQRGSVTRAQRAVIGAVGHPAAGERDVAARMQLDREEFHHLAIRGAVIDRELAGIRLGRHVIGNDAAGIIALERRYPVGPRRPAFRSIWHPDPRP